MDDGVTGAVCVMDGQILSATGQGRQWRRDTGAEEETTTGTKNQKKDWAGVC